MISKSSCFGLTSGGNKHVSMRARVRPRRSCSCHTFVELLKALKLWSEAAFGSSVHHQDDLALEVGERVFLALLIFGREVEEGGSGRHGGVSGSSVGEGYGGGKDDALGGRVEDRDCSTRHHSLAWCGERGNCHGRSSSPSHLPRHERCRHSLLPETTTSPTESAQKSRTPRIRDQALRPPCYRRFISLSYPPTDVWRRRDRAGRRSRSSPDRQPADAAAPTRPTRLVLSHEDPPAVGTRPPYYVS